MTATHAHRRVVWMQLKDPSLLRMAIKSRGFTHRELATRAGLSAHGMIGHLLSGRRKSCTSDTATGLCAALDVPVDLLFLPHVSTPTSAPVKPEGKAA